jgi:hypothetical protein
MIFWISVVFVVITPFAFLILLMWVFFSPHFSQVWQASVSLIYFFQEPVFCFIVSSYFCLFVSASLISALIFIIFLLLLVLGFAYSCFSSSLRCSIRSLIWDLSVLLINALMAINFPLRIAFVVSHRFQ